MEVESCHVQYMVIHCNANYVRRSLIVVNVTTAIDTLPPITCLIISFVLLSSM
ncbi:hypothetical protein BDV59DRAFT_65196 [Aspergillus ambiguus]|uniref:uncharacterized protein n=1 Tax=Aspergillus ambiguus TaxID=176160 RepID=UPI003CCDE09B